MTDFASTFVPPPSCNGRGISSLLDTGRLDFDDLQKIINAHAFASTITPLNTHATILLEHAPDYSPEDAEWLGRFMDKTSRWLIRRGIPPAYVWVMERGQQKGRHLHALLHLNDYGRQRAPLEAFMIETGRFREFEGKGDRPVLLTGGQYGMQAHKRRAGCLSYLLKTAEPELALALGIDPAKRPRPVSGRRCAVSHSIGATARAAANWRELTTLDELRAYLDPNSATNSTTATKETTA